MIGQKKVDLFPEIAGWKFLHYSPARIVEYATIYIFNFKKETKEEYKKKKQKKLKKKREYLWKI